MDTYVLKQRLEALKPHIVNTDDKHSAYSLGVIEGLISAYEAVQNGNGEQSLFKQIVMQEFLTAIQLAGIKHLQELSSIIDRLTNRKEENGEEGQSTGEHRPTGEV